MPVGSPDTGGHGSHGHVDGAGGDQLGPGAEVQGARRLWSMITRLPGEPVTVLDDGPNGALAFTGAVVRDGDAYEAYHPWAIPRRKAPVFPEAECSDRRVLP
ncbi:MULTISPECIES: hypothetical protein [unclassified Streptomyces]|uniref:hypothetical protein n=1 Tax=unclassified Streptomyces TaxID=2593676 RepID=UPI00332DEDC4